MEDSKSREQRKEEGKRQKRQRIEEAGGKRPRIINDPNASGEKRNDPEKRMHHHQGKQKVPSGRKSKSESHRFGRVMDTVPCRGVPRHSTLSIAVPGSVVSNCQTRELRTQMVGQIARAATIYHVDEIVVYDDKLSQETKNFRSFYHRRDRQGKPENEDDPKKSDDKVQEDSNKYKASGPNLFMARIFQYCECPQYLRKHFFPMHPDLQFAGLLAPVDAPHHVRVGDRSTFREGVVLEKTAPTGKSLVNCGIRSRPVEIDMTLQPGIRCTVQLDDSVYSSTGRPKGVVVSPSTPREKDGTYWGYTTRMASSITAAIEECPYEGGYDLKLGTSERGHSSLDDSTFRIPEFRHALIVFGGVAGIEECVDADESIKLPGKDSHKLFDLWINICPFQGSRTIRTEEAVLISLAKFSPILTSAETKKLATKGEGIASDAPAVQLSSDEALSEESSEEEE